MWIYKSNECKNQKYFIFCQEHNFKSKNTTRLPLWWTAPSEAKAIVYLVKGYNSPMKNYKQTLIKANSNESSYKSDRSCDTFEFWRLGEGHW